MQGLHSDTLVDLDRHHKNQGLAVEAPDRPLV